MYNKIDLKPEEFQQTVRNFYNNHGRKLPWRNTTNPYKIFVSEIMLQQTQAQRVVPKYHEWITTWPTFQALANADKAEVLQQWQGLGYNRRANYLYQSANTVVSEHDGRLPRKESDLLSLHGVGPYTAGALQAFCFNKPIVFVETNIRTVFIHHYFPNQDSIADKEIKERVQETLPSKNIREWYWGLMDYGHHLKQEVGNLNRQSETHQSQSTFKGSNRQLRSKLLQFILNNEPVSLEEIKRNIEPNTPRQKSVKNNLKNLRDEELISRNDDQQYRAG